MARKNSNSGCGCLVIILILVLLLVVLTLAVTALPYYLALLALVALAALISGFILMIIRVVRAMSSTKSSGLFFRRGLDPNPVEPSYERFFYFKGDWWINWCGILKTVAQYDFNSPPATVLHIREKLYQTKVKIIKISDRKILFWGMFILAAPLVLAWIIPKYFGHLGGSIVVLLITSLLWILVFAFCNLFSCTVIGLDYIAGLFRRFFSQRISCAKCKTELQHVAYECPVCLRKVHGALAPSLKYGVLFHTCYCGAKLPASQQWGREYLRPVCPTRCPK